MNKNVEYPNYILRGFTTQDCIDNEIGCILPNSFRFDGNHCNENDFDEESINWYDNEDALVQMQSQRKTGTNNLKFCYGIGRMPTNKIKSISKKYMNKLSYERKPVEGNEFHGNLLLHKDFFKKDRKQLIKVELALSFDMLLEYKENDNIWIWKSINYND